MAQKNLPILFSFIALLLAPIFSSPNGSERKDHIVDMGSIKNRAIAKSTHHLNLLQSVIETSFNAESSYIRSYGRSFNGFAAKLTDAETEQLAAMEGVVSVFESKKLKTQTTRLWDFLGFDKNTKRNLAGENDVIIGSFDTGIWPESESFSGFGFSPPPPRWKGVCAGGVNFTCNSKVIGARHYSTASSARDSTGHGTHTASTAAGNSVETEGFYGIGGGVARGGVPSSRIAVYNVCDPGGCSEVDILAAFDDAIADGVDIITISIGGLGADDFTMDSIAIGSFHAMARGILTVHSAGNDGPVEGSVGSVAPWILTVGATTTDRSIVDKVVLGNGKTITGYTVNSFTPNNNISIIYGSKVTKNCSSDDSELCTEGCLDPGLVKGKIVLCRHYDGASEAYNSGAAGTIIYNSHFENVSLISPFPAAALPWEDFKAVANYSATTIPHVRILKSAAVTDPFAPTAAQFSSRGPNPLLPEILKPDVAAPGVEILAAFSPIVSPSKTLADKRSTNYSVLSGTSMACPHVAGVAAYVKSFHPNWSPTMIKSAVMTTAKPISNTDGSQIGEFLHGSGLINPRDAVKPGLVYEIFEGDYVKLLCGNGFDSKTVGLISGNKSGCSRNPAVFPARDLNYPAMVGRVSPMKAFVVKFQRTVTNVGGVNSSYRSEILPVSKFRAEKSPENVKVSVEPPEIRFGDLNEKKSFVVTVAGREIPAETVFSSALVWSDGIHKVRSSIVVSVSS